MMPASFTLEMSVCPLSICGSQRCSTTKSAARQPGGCATQKKRDDVKGSVRIESPPITVHIMHNLLLP
jgi:hypothetical protein